MELGRIANRYGVGVDCHSRFFQACALARCDDVVLKYKDKCDAAFGRLALCKARATGRLDATGIAHEPFKYTPGATAPYHRPLVKAWGSDPSIDSTGRGIRDAWRPLGPCSEDLAKTD
jgi:hypothetical protein